jgi:cell wall-associated NlpC family hydrolase
MQSRTVVGGTAAAAAALLALLVALPLITVLAAGTVATSQPAGEGGVGLSGQVPAEYAPLIEEAGTRCPDRGITAPVLAAQIDAESGWQPNAISPAGAQGLAQFMPGTWASWGTDYSGDGVADAFTAADAIGSQAEFMCYLAGWAASQRQLGLITGDPLDLTLAAYNAGPGNVSTYGGVPPFAETQGYITRIRGLIPAYSAPAPVETVPAGSSPVVAQASRWLGRPYVWGGGDLSGPTGIGRDGRGPGFDCSGLTRYAVYHGIGVDISRPADWQARQGQPIARDWSQMRPGDLIAFSDSGGARYQHIAVYAGNGEMIHAPRTGENVEVYQLRGDSYFTPMVWSIRRFSS